VAEKQQKEQKKRLGRRARFHIIWCGIDAIVGRRGNETLASAVAIAGFRL